MIPHRRGRLDREVRHLHAPRRYRSPRRCRIRPGRRCCLPDRGNHRLAHAVGGAQAELLAQLAEDVDRAGIGRGELHGLRDDRREHRLEIERGVHGVADLAERPQLLDRTARGPACAPGPRRTSRTFSIAITAWSAKVVSELDLLSVKGRTARRVESRPRRSVAALAQQRHARGRCGSPAIASGRRACGNSGPPGRPRCERSCPREWRAR